MTDIDTCRYTKLIENYDSLGIEDFKITKKRLEYLYKLYTMCTEEQIERFISRIEEVLETRLSFSIHLENIDKMIEFGRTRILNSENEERLGECLPVILVLEKELQNVCKPLEKVDDSINTWMLNYLRKYDKRLHISKDNYDEYDVLYAYSRIGFKQAIFETCIYGLKIKAYFANLKKK